MRLAEAAVQRGADLGLDLDGPLLQPADMACDDARVTSFINRCATG
jgi:hypothetical protein